MCMTTLGKPLWTKTITTCHTPEGACLGTGPAPYLRYKYQSVTTWSIVCQGCKSYSSGKRGYSWCI